MASSERSLPIIGSVVSAINSGLDYLGLRLLSNSSRLSAIKRAVTIPSERTQAFSSSRSMFKSSAEELMHFLAYHRLETADAIASEYSEYLQANFTKNSAPSKDEQIRKFLALVLKHSHDVYELDIRDYHNNPDAYKNDLACMREFKKLYSRTCNESGYDSLGYTQLSAEDLKQLATTSGIVNIYKYTDYTPDDDFAFHKLEKSKDKVNKRFSENALFYGLVVLNLILVVGEGSSPANFALQKLTGIAALTTVAGGMPLYGVVFGVFLAAASVSYVLFHPESVIAFKNIFLKGELHRSPKEQGGNLLPLTEILANVARLALSCFSATVLAIISYKYTLLGSAAVAVGLPLSLGMAFAAVVSVATFVGYSAVLTNASRSVLTLKTLKSLKEGLYNLIASPFNKLNRKNTVLQNLGYSALVIFNSLAVMTTGILALSVAPATTAMFYDAVLSMGMVGATTSAVIVGFAQVSLVTFFVKNLAGMINLLRASVVDAFATKAQAEGNQQPNAYRAKIQNTANMTRGQFVVNAIINAAGFITGYLETIITHRYVANVFNILSLGHFSRAPQGTARVLAASSYGVASIGGNALAAWNGLAPAVPMHAKPVYKQLSASDKFFPAAVQSDSDLGGAQSSQVSTDSDASRPTPTLDPILFSLAHLASRASTEVVDDSASKVADRHEEDITVTELGEALQLYPSATGSR